MGLGKTLSSLALLWTLIKQGPTGKPSIHKALVITPSSLTRSWEQECKKWLGDERLKTLVIQPGAAGAQQVMDFSAGAVYRVAIMSYESVRQHASRLADHVHLLIADEGHRLKSAKVNKTIEALCTLRCHRRVVLTGTPVQNNLSEFYAMCDFVNPNILGSLSVFNRLFANPIALSRDKHATVEAKSLGDARSRELTRRVESFVLRRDADSMTAYLPPLSTFVVFCKPSKLQVRLITSVLQSGSVQQILGQNRKGPVVRKTNFGDQALSALTVLRKICNHPLLHQTINDPGPNDTNNDTIDTSITPKSDHTFLDEDGSSSSLLNSITIKQEINMTQDKSLSQQPPNDTAVEEKARLSGKMATLAVLLHHIIALQGHRCIVVSQFTTTLDLCEEYCTAKGYSVVRIDGSTDSSKRQDIVDAFNRFNVGQVFLLSTTAGGVGLNLVGAHCLVLYDSHWNPALDKQAMARIWRDGQRQSCVVYRLLTTGTVEEKIYQRQRSKGDIAQSVMMEGRGSGIVRGGQFSREDLRVLFTLRTDTRCDTADVMVSKGVCSPHGGSDNGDSIVFDDVSGDCEDVPLKAAVNEGLVTFVYKETSDGRDKAVHRSVTTTATAGRNHHHVDMTVRMNENAEMRCDGGEHGAAHEAVGSITKKRDDAPIDPVDDDDDDTRGDVTMHDTGDGAFELDIDD